ncbi:hypothetical protein M758_UG145200 [Ceratodon purpureus]|nr:hypothetical protein M758_UG145200 [Ceratodon purpureus]
MWSQPKQHCTGNVAHKMSNRMIWREQCDCQKLTLENKTHCRQHLRTTCSQDHLMHSKPVTNISLILKRNYEKKMFASRKSKLRNVIQLVSNAMGYRSQEPNKKI